MPLHAVRIGIVSNNSWWGERELGHRMKLAAESLGWEVVLDGSKDVYLEHVKGLDWVISLIPGNKTLYSCPTYQAIFHPFDYFDKRQKLLPFYEKYDGFLITLNPSQSFIKYIKNHKEGRFALPFYPSLQDIPYRQIFPRELMMLLPAWGNRKREEKYKNLFTLLDGGGFTRFYGPKSELSAYLGILPFDGISVIEAMQKHGIVLIIHSDVHNKAKIPSARIFEAAAASAVIICDKNSFVRKHFGDSVFYIDTSLSEELIYEQIQKHIETIHSNPENALEMAKKSHQIFKDQFQMAVQLLRLEEKHNQLMAKRNA